MQESGPGLDPNRLPGHGLSEIRPTRNNDSRGSRRDNNNTANGIRKKEAQLHSVGLILNSVCWLPVP